MAYGYVNIKRGCSLSPAEWNGGTFILAEKLTSCNLFFFAETGRRCARVCARTFFRPAVCFYFFVFGKQEGALVQKSTRPQGGVALSPTCFPNTEVREGSPILLAHGRKRADRRKRGPARTEQRKKRKCKGHTCRWRFPKEIQPLALACFFCFAILMCGGKPPPSIWARLFSAQTFLFLFFARKKIHSKRATEFRALRKKFDALGAHSFFCCD